MTDVLLTGANGFLGRAITNELSNDCNIFKLSRTSGEFKVSLEKEVLDFKRKFELVIHSAGKAHTTPKSEFEKKQFYDINVLGTENLLRSLEVSGVPEKFVFISSVSVYGQNEGNKIDENHLLKAKDPYGLSKIEAEKIIQEWCFKNKVICTILRLPLLVGKNPPGNLGAMVRAIEKGYYFNIGRGVARKSMVLVEDVAAIILKSATIGGVYNLTDGQHPSFNELSLTISKKINKRKPLNLPLFVVKIMAKGGDLLGHKSPITSLKLKKITSNLTFDDSKAKNILNWNPQSVIKYLEKKNI